MREYTYTIKFKPVDIQLTGTIELSTNVYDAAEQIAAVFGMNIKVPVGEPTRCLTLSWSGSGDKEVVFALV